MKQYIKKPLPNDRLHSQSDEALKFLVKTYKDLLSKRDEPSYVKCVQDRINDIYSVLGYRCALDYIEKYGD